MKYLGLDWGKAKIGVAIGSDEVKIASPIFILLYKSLPELEIELQKIIEQENIEALVVGRPVSLSGDKTMSINYQEFITLLEKYQIPIIYEDERLSTKYAASIKKEFSNYKKVGDDDVAAAAILQTFFDRL